MPEKDMTYLACSYALQVKSRGCNCAQASLCGLSSFLGLDEGFALKLMAAFGGGMNHQQLCGAAVGAGAALGLALGSGDCDKAANERMILLTKEFVDRFSAELGTTVCGQLLADKLEVFCWDMPEDMAKTDPNNAGGKEFNLKAPVCGRAITCAVKFALEIIQREKGL